MHSAPSQAMFTFTTPSISSFSYPSHPPYYHLLPKNPCLFLAPSLNPDSLHTTHHLYSPLPYSCPHFQAHPRHSSIVAQQSLAITNTFAKFQLAPPLSHSALQHLTPLPLTPLFPSFPSSLTSTQHFPQDPFKFSLKTSSAIFSPLNLPSYPILLPLPLLSCLLFLLVHLPTSAQSRLRFAPSAPWTFAGIRLPAPQPSYPAHPFTVPYPFVPFLHLPTWATPPHTILNHYPSYFISSYLFSPLPTFPGISSHLMGFLHHVTHSHIVGIASMCFSTPRRTSSCFGRHPHPQSPLASVTSYHS